jgi:hypothetical protein
MAVTNLQSNLVPISVSADSGVTWLNVVCKKGWKFNHETSTTEEETDCGTLTGIGSNKWSFDVEGVVNTTPGAGSEVSAEGLLGYAHNQTALLVRAQYPTSGSPGTDLYASGTAYITNLVINNSVGSLLGFTCTFKGTGTLDITP